MKKVEPKPAENPESCGWRWRTPPGMSVIVREATDSRDEGHRIPGKEANSCSVWILNYFFTPSRVWHCTTGKWEERAPFVAHLYPRMFRYREDSRAYKPPHHLCWIKFDLEDQTRLAPFIANRFSYARFRDPDHVLGQRLVAIAGVAAIQREKGYWTVSRMVDDLVNDLAGAAPCEEGIYEVRKIRSTETRDALVDAAMGFLSAHLAETIDVNDVARHLHVSRSTLAHRFSKARGEGVHEALLQLRLLQAKSLLQRGLKLDTIAEETGFCDGRHLSRAFRHAEGISPADHLRRLAARKPAEPWFAS